MKSFARDGEHVIVFGGHYTDSDINVRKQLEILIGHGARRLPDVTSAVQLDRSWDRAHRSGPGAARYCIPSHLYLVSTRQPGHVRLVDVGTYQNARQIRF